MGIQIGRLSYLLFQTVKMCVIFTSLKLWVAVARHNFKRVKIKFYNLSLLNQVEFNSARILSACEEKG